MPPLLAWEISSLTSSSSSHHPKSDMHRISDESTISSFAHAVAEKLLGISPWYAMLQRTLKSITLSSGKYSCSFFSVISIDYAAKLKHHCAKSWQLQGLYYVCLKRTNLHFCCLILYILKHHDGHIHYLTKEADN